jgi:hypothetical protein
VKTLLTVILGVVWSVNAIAQSAGDLPHTIDVIEASVRELADTMISRCDLVPGTAVPVSLRQHPDADWIRSLMQRRFEERGIATISVNDTASPAVSVVIENASTRYAPSSASDSVERSIVVQLSVECKGRPLALAPVTHRATMARQNVDAYQSRQHMATHAPLPNPESSVWDDVLEPLIYVAAAAVTVVLFFTVRTQ